MTDKDKMIEEMANEIENFVGISHYELSWNAKIMLAEHLFNAGIRPKEGFIGKAQGLDVVVIQKQYKEEK